MVVPLRSQVRLRHSLLHWAYFGLFPPQAAASVRPLFAKREPFGKWNYRMKQHHPKASFFPKEKGAYEGRRQWRKQAVVSPVKQGTSQVRFAHEARRPC